MKRVVCLLTLGIASSVFAQNSAKNPGRNSARPVVKGSSKSSVKSPSKIVAKGPAKSGVRGAIKGKGAAKGSAKRPAKSARSSVAPRLIVDTRSGYLLGAWASNWWIKPDKAAKWARGQENYAVFEGPHLMGTYRGSAGRSLGSECPNTQVVQIALPPRRRGVLSPALPKAIGVSGLSPAQVGSLMPRPVKAEPIAASHKAIVAQWLRSHGVARPQVFISKVWSADLDGDGRREILISAIRHRGEKGLLQIARNGVFAGDYSLLLVRRNTQRGAQTIAVDSQIHAKDYFSAVPSFRELTAVLDLNGDGKMEIVAWGSYYQGSWATVYEWRGGKLQVALQEGCGV